MVLRIIWKQKSVGYTRLEDDMLSFIMNRKRQIS